MDSQDPLYLRDPRDRHPYLQRIIKVTIYGGMAIGGVLIALLALAALIGD